jgi:hypothetical protein
MRDSLLQPPLENLLVDLKPEFNSDNKRLYSDEHGARILAEGEI